MVQVVTTAIRSQAQQAQRQVVQQQRRLDTQKSQLERQRGQLTSARAIRTLSREARELQTRQLSSTQQQIQQQTTSLQSATRELQRIRELPTAQELLSKAKSSFQIDLKIARKAISRKDAGLLTNKRQREFFRKLNQGRSDSAIIKELEFKLKSFFKHYEVTRFPSKDVYGHKISDGSLLIFKKNDPTEIISKFPELIP